MSAIKIAIVLYIVMGFQFTMLMFMIDVRDCGFGSLFKRTLWYIVFCATWPVWLVVELYVYAVDWMKHRRMEKTDDHA